MNLVDCVVTAVTGPPRKTSYNDNERWWVPVNYDSMGGFGNSEIMCHSLEEAEAVKVGMEFLA